MKKEKFTPGPWVQLKNSDATNIWIGGEKEYVCMVDSHISKNNANAALIAAAPDLYEACQAVVDGYEGDEMEDMGPRDEIFYKWCKKAIAKARGENVE